MVWMYGVTGLLTGCIAGALCVFFCWKKSYKKYAEEREQTGRNLAELRALNVSAEDRLKACQQQAEAEKQLLSQGFDRERTLTAEAHEKELASLSEKYESELSHQKELAEKTQQTTAEAWAAEKKVLLGQTETLKTNHAADFEKMQKDHQSQLALLKEEFKNLSEKVLSENTDKLHTANKEQLELLLNPLREKMGEFRSAVEESKNKGIEMNTSLREELKKMMQETERIGGEARDLAKALRSEQKTQGDWGELILENILKQSGLVKGQHYECQETIRDEDGKVVHSEDEKRMRPDVVIHYPDGRDVVVDSKVSLKAYVDYCNAEDENKREECRKRHLQSVENHVKELERVSYAEYLQKSGHNAIDFTVMFIPNEGSFHLAMVSDPALWNEAFKKKILIVSPTNLMALLCIIHIAWTREEQNRNQQEILSAASTLLDRLYSFYEDLNEVGDAISNVQKKYDAAVHRLNGGKGARSVINAGNKMKQLGVKVAKEKKLPSRFVDLELEIDSLPEEGNAKSMQEEPSAVKELVSDDPGSSKTDE